MGDGLDPGFEVGKNNYAFTPSHLLQTTVPQVTGVYQPKVMQQLELNWKAALEPTSDFPAGLPSPQPSHQPETQRLKSPDAAPPEGLDSGAGDGQMPLREDQQGQYTPEHPGTAGQQKHRALLTELAYSDPLHSNQTERIHHLEQALDQCQRFIQELKLQLADQAFLENQLAATEEAAQIQQQAIAALKAQLLDQSQLTTELAQVRQQNQELQTDLIETENQIQTQQTEISQLKTQVDQGQSTLSDRQGAIQALEAQLQRTQAVLAGQQEVISALQTTQSPDSEKNKVIQGLSKNLLTAQAKVEALETKFSSQLLHQAKLQHSHQELEGQSGFYRDRTTQLEQQVAEMQEQILQQAKQASEYEAGVQHWKDHCLFAEQSVLQLKAVLEQILTDRNLLELVSAEKATGMPDHPNPAALESAESASSRFLKNLKIELPAFLHLKRHYKS